MTWLLWREYRLNRWILVTGAAAILLFCVIGFLLNLFQVDEELNNLGGIAALVWSFLTVALLAGNAFAGELRRSFSGIHQLSTAGTIAQIGK